MGLDSIWHWLVVLLIVVVLFGTKRLKNVGGDLGEAVRGFKKGMRADDANDAPPQPATTQSLPPAAASDAARPAPTIVQPDDDRNPPVAR